MFHTLERYHFREVDDVSFYTEIFKLGQGFLQKENKDKKNFKANPIGIGMNKDKKPFKRIMFEDTFFDSLKELQSSDFSILSGLTYFGRKNTLERASKAFAMIFDIDNLGGEELGNYLFGVKNEVYPAPTYVVLSGQGIHAYYLFEEPVSLYPMTKLAMKELKYRLTDLMWNQYTSKEKNKQFQGINQGFRIVGSKTKKKGVVRAYTRDQGKVTLEYLNSFLPEYKQVDFSSLYKETTMSLEEAKEKYPDWYQRKIIKKEPRRTWTTHEGLYEWWLEKIKRETTFGHRYYAIMALAIYAMKSNIPFEQLERDALSLIPTFNQINEENPFTRDDVESALECYDVKYKTFPRSDFEKITAIAIPVNKRNYRPREQHVKIMNAIREVTHPDGSWRNLEGRPTKQDVVEEWQQNNPKGRKVDCIRETGLSKPTVYKWWNDEGSR